MQRILLTLVLTFSLSMLFGQWVQLNNAPYVNHHSNGFGIDGKAYIIQGISTTVNGQLGNMLWEYTPDDDTWTPLGHVPAQDRGFAIGDDMDGKYYFGFGFDRSDVWEFDPQTMEFTQLPSCPCVNRGHPAFVAHDGKIYVGGGGSGTGNLNDWWIYDFATETWERKANIPGAARHHPYQFGIGDYIYVGGGHVGNWLRWDIANETWSAIDDMPGGRVAGSQFSYKGKGFILSGDTAQHDPLTSNNFLMYDPDSDEWFDLPFENSMHRWAGSSFIIDNFLYYFGGFGANPGGNDSNMFRFDLDEVQCLAPTRIFTQGITENSAELFWSNGPSGEIDGFEWREAGGDWNEVLTTESVFLLENLESCTDYEYRVHTDCGDDGEVFSEIVAFRTAGCGACIDNTYCGVGTYSALTGFLNSVSIETFTNESGNNGGFAEFPESRSIEVSIGGEFDLTFEPEISGSNQRYNLKVYMDLNVDGQFDEDAELVLEESFTDGNEVTRTLTVPSTAEEGLSRLRVFLNLDDIDGPCGQPGIQNGEVEDYCITIVDGATSTINPDAFDKLNIFPNPFSDELLIDLNDFENVGELSLETIQGVRILTRNMDQYSASKVALQTSNIPAGIYILRGLSADGKQLTSQKVIKH